MSRPVPEKTIQTRTEAYGKMHELSWLLHNAPLWLIKKPERIVKKIEEAIAICESSHEEARKAKKVK